MFKEYSFVRVKKLKRPIDTYDSFGLNRRPPQVGDIGTIVDILQGRNLPIHYTVENPDSDGVPIWLSEFEAEEFELVEEMSGSRKL